ncbi:MAG: preprotein translocase subunit SecE [Bryobacteraceae bacterium]
MATVANAEQPQDKPLGAVGSWVERFREYAKDLRAEMTRVTWPSRKQVQATTAVVLITIFAFAFYFAAVDIVMGRLIKRLFDTFAK